MFPIFDKNHVDWNRLGTRQRVLNRLLSALVNNEHYRLHDSRYPGSQDWVSGGYLPAWEFQEKNIGGTSGMRRLRDLRFIHGVPGLEPHPHLWTVYDPARENDIRITTPVYRIDADPEWVLRRDWSGAWERPFRWHWTEVLQSGRASVAIHENSGGQLCFL